MNIIQLLKNYEKICLSFESKDEDELKKRLMILGYRIPEDFCSPVIIHRDGTLSFITGFVSGMFFNQPKEKLKEKFPGVDVLTLSATPIPRTLNMAMTGIRDMSSLEIPPVGRHPVRLKKLNQRIVMGELWHNTRWKFSGMVTPYKVPALSIVPRRWVTTINWVFSDRCFK